MADREKFNPKTNVPEQIALRYATGREMSGNYGDSVMFTLVDGRVWFAPPIVARKIYELGVEAGELFEVEKSEVMQGNRRTVKFEVRRLSVEEELAATSTGAPTTAMVRAAAQQTQTVQQVPPGSVAPAPTAINANRGRELAVETLQRSFEVAIDAMIATRDYAARQGLDLKFTEPNIISVAMSVFINAAKESGKWHAA